MYHPTHFKLQNCRLLTFLEKLENLSGGIGGEREMGETGREDETLPEAQRTQKLTP